MIYDATISFLVTVYFDAIRTRSSLVGNPTPLKMFYYT